MNTERKVVLITGSSNGLGKLTAETLADDGHIVYASMRNSETKNKAVKEEMEAYAQQKDVSLKVVDMDVTDDDSVAAAIAEVVKKENRIDVLVNNAGVMNSGVTEAFTLDQVKGQFDVNLFASIRTIRSVVPHMRHQGSGLLVQLSTLAGRAVFPFFGIYCASKFAVEALAESYRYELNGFGIDSVIVEPGPFDTNLITAAPRPADTETLNAYGAFAGAAEQVLEGFQAMFKEGNTPPPQEVATAVSKLVTMKNGERPLRTIVSGNDFGVGEINRLVAPIQQELLGAMSLGHIQAH